MKVLLAVLMFSASCFAQNTFPETGKPAPEVELRQLLQAPDGTLPRLEALRGKAVVMEFWATWCGGCVAAIPHLNALADQFQNKGVVFLSVTDEDPGIVQAFLKKRIIKGWVGIDRDGATFKAYGVDGRPQAFLIDAQGVLRGPVESSRLDEATLDRFLAGQPLGDAIERNQPVWPPLERQQGAPSPLLQVVIRPAAPPSVSGQVSGAYIDAGQGRFEEYAVTIRRMLSEKESMREDRIVLPTWAETPRYDVSTVVPQGLGAIRNDLVVNMLTATFQMKSHREMRPTSVYVLSRAQDAALKVRASSAKPSIGFLSGPGQFTGLATTIAQMIQRLDTSGLEVLDDTNLTGVYDFKLSWNKGDMESQAAALHDQLGLDLKRETRPREFLVIDSAVEPKTR